MSFCRKMAELSNWKLDFRKVCLLDRENSKRLSHKEQERRKKCLDGKVCVQFHSLPVPAISATRCPVVLLVGIWVSPSTTWDPTDVPHHLLIFSTYIFLLPSLLCRAPWAGGDITSFSLTDPTYPFVESSSSWAPGSEQNKLILCAVLWQLYLNVFHVL